jgi:predicted AAA+ superfamily ATPase
MDTVSVLGHAYTPRLIDSLVEESLEAAGAVLIEGPRACGKTMTATHAAASIIKLDEPSAAAIVAHAPEAVLDGDYPRLLDEWQLAPQLWNLVRRHVDASPQTGLFLLTGSAVPADDATRHTGAGRFLRLRQRTMTWCERRLWDGGEVSLRNLFAGAIPAPRLAPVMTYAEVLTELARPGFPALAARRPAYAHRLLRAYMDEVARTDVPKLIDMRHDPIVVRRLIDALARRVSSEVSYIGLAADLVEVAPGIKPDTVAVYFDALERLFFVERQAAWTPRLRSRARLRAAAKLHLADPSLAMASMGVDAAGLHADPATAGLLFESAVVHDLQVLTAAMEGEVRHFRDSNGYEIDAVVELPGGRWGAVEIKLGGVQAGPGADRLNKAIGQLDPGSVRPPAFRLVVTGTGGTYVMSDGTMTCPLAALRP